MLVNGDITSSRVPAGESAAHLAPEGGQAVHRRSRSRTSSATSRTCSSRSTARTPCAPAGSRSTRRSRRACSAPRLRQSRTCSPTDGSGVRDRLDRSTHGSDQGDDGGDAGSQGNQFNFATSARRQPGSTFKTITLTTAVARGLDPFSVSYLSAPFHYQPDPLCNSADPNCAWDVQTYDAHYAGRRVGRERDPAVRQHRLRAAGARRRARRTS